VPWLCAGDFNEVLTGEEHFGANDRDDRQMEAFQEVKADCGFTDLGFRGLPFTWDNKQEGSRNVKARLDRAFGDDQFLNSLGNTSVEHIQLAKSDNCGLLVSVRQHVANQQGRQETSKPFGVRICGSAMKGIGGL
jgi:hypothetical protein